MNISSYTKFFALLSLIWLALNGGAVQATDSEGWPIVEQCITDAIPLPDNNSAFEGTIIAEGWAGIHGINADWNTPRILAFNNQWITERDRGGSGTLSPNGKWYAIPRGSMTYVFPYGGDVRITNLLIYDLTGEQNLITLEWQDKYELFFGSGTTRYKGERTPVWFDEVTVIYQQGGKYYFIHLPRVEIEEWSEPLNWSELSPVWTFLARPSPDWSRIVTGSYVFDPIENEYLTRLYQPVTNFDVGTVSWHPASTEFIFSVSEFTKIFDADGNLISTVAPPVEPDGISYTQIEANSFSPDGRKFWLNHRASSSSHLAIADRTAETMVDTCLDSKQAYFSPDSRYLTFTQAPYEYSQLQILDLETWQLYDTGIYHEGKIIGWRDT